MAAAKSGAVERQHELDALREELDAEGARRRRAAAGGAEAQRALEVARSELEASRDELAGREEVARTEAASFRRKLRGTLRKPGGLEDYEDEEGGSGGRQQPAQGAKVLRNARGRCGAAACAPPRELVQRSSGGPRPHTTWQCHGRRHRS